MARDQEALNKYESLPCLRTFLLGVIKGVAFKNGIASSWEDFV
jgi:hypothetical protein